MSTATPMAMLIDSDEHVRELMRVKLEAGGITVDTVLPHGILAQQAIHQMQPQLIFIAIEQPLQRAMQVVDYARALMPDGMIVAYSGAWSPTVERRLMQAGVNDFLHGKVTREQIKSIGERARRYAKLSAEPVPEKEDVGRIVCVIGQKGGIGKTTTSTNIAAAIAVEGSKSVLLIDLDTRFGDVAVMMDVKANYSVSEVACDPGYLERDTFRSVLLRHESGAYVLPAPRDYRSWLNCSTEQLMAMIQFAATMFDVVVLDTPGTLNDVVGASTDLADRIVVVTSTDLSSLKNTSLLVEHLALKGRTEDEVFVALIHGHDIEGGPAKSDVEYAISRPVNYEIPFDRNVRRASQVGVPVVQLSPNTAASIAFGQLAGELAGYRYSPVEPVDPVRRRFFRVFGSRKSTVANVERKAVAS